MNSWRSVSCARSAPSRASFLTWQSVRAAGEYAVDKKGDSVDGKRKSDICRPIGARYWTWCRRRRKGGGCMPMLGGGTPASMIQRGEWQSLPITHKSTPLFY